MLSAPDFESVRFKSGREWARSGRDLGGRGSRFAETPLDRDRHRRQSVTLTRPQCGHVKRYDPRQISRRLGP